MILKVSFLKLQIILFIIFTIIPKNLIPHWCLHLILLQLPRVFPRTDI